MIENADNSLIQQSRIVRIEENATSAGSSRIIKNKNQNRIRRRNDTRRK